jgi:hypothetical protein
MLLNNLAEMCLSEKHDDYKQNRAAIAKLHGHRFIVMAMVKWFESCTRDCHKVLGAGCYALQHSLCDMPWEVCGFAVEVGALDTVLSAIKYNPDNEYIQWYGCGALSHIAWHKQNAQHLAWKLDDGLDIVTSAMRSYSEDVNIQKSGYKLFTRISQWDEFKDPIIRAGLPHLLFTTINKP